MNKKILLATAVTLLLGTTTVMADNHRHHDGPQGHKKEAVHKSSKSDKVARSNRHFDSKNKHHAPKPKPVVNHAHKPKPAVHVHHRHPKPMPKPACAPYGRHGKGCHYCYSCRNHHSGHCRPLPPRRPVKRHVRVTPPFSPIQVTVRI